MTASDELRQFQAGQLGAAEQMLRSAEASVRERNPGLPEAEWVLILASRTQTVERLRERIAYLRSELAT